MENKNDNNPLIKYFSIIKQQHFIFLNRHLEDEVISAGQTLFLMYLLYKENSCQEEIAKYYKLDKGTVARGIKKLEDLNLIFKEVDANNRRKYCLHLSDEGKRIAQKIIEINNEWEDKFCLDIGIEKEKLSIILKQITDNSIELNSLKNTEDLNE